MARIRRSLKPLLTTALLAALALSGSTVSAASAATAKPRATKSTTLPALNMNMFSATSWVRAPLPATAALNPDQSLAGAFASQVKQFGTWVNTTSWSSPIYVVGPDQPKIDITVDSKMSRYSKTDQVYLARDFTGVPLPPDAQPAGPLDSPSISWVDHELIVYQPSTDTAWEIYHLVNRGTYWTATGGGKITHVSTSDGHLDPWPSGTSHSLTASGISMLAVIQRLDELQAGRINHAVAVSIPHPSSIFTAPALRSDGAFTTPDAVPEGTRFRLPASLNIDALPLTPYAKMVAHAIQTYGLIVVDRDCQPTDLTCPAVTFKAEDPRPLPDASHVNPYTAIFGGVATNHLFDNFPWDKLQVLPQD
jgi:hypothetical protein